MADVSEVVQRSMNINEKLGPRLVAAAEQNAILRIGWTNAGDPVPKNGELGLCPALPDGARLRALGVLGSWTTEEACMQLLFVHAIRSHPTVDPA